MPATTGYFAWGCFPYFSWEREPPRPQVVANGKSGQPGRFEEDGEGSAAVGKGGSLTASQAALSPHPEEAAKRPSRRTTARLVILRGSPSGAGAPQGSHLRMTECFYSAAFAAACTRYCTAGCGAARRARPVPNSFSRNVPFR